MARGARLTGEERRIQIMEAALNVFAAKGFNGARTKEIAREAGVSETLIFQHFKTKEELYFRSVHALFNHHPLLNELEEKLAQEDDEAVFLTAALHIIHHGLEDPRIIRLGLFNGLEGSDLAHRAHQERFMESGERLPEDELVSYVEKRIKAGAFRPVDPRTVVKLFLSLVFFTIADQNLHLIGRPLDLSEEELARTLVDVFLNGIRG